MTKELPTGVLFSFEGPEGSGKTTQVNMLYEYLKKRRLKCRKIKEPGSTLIGKHIRKILLTPTFQNISPITEMFLYAAARSQLIHEIIKPALLNKEIVLCDRYIDSSLVYQGYANSLGLKNVFAINKRAIKGLMPQKTFLFMLKASKIEERLKKRQTKKDRIEAKPLDFHIKVCKGYLLLAKIFKKRIKVIDAQKDPLAIHKEVLEEILDYCKVI